MMSYEEFVEKAEKDEEWAPGWEAIDEVFDQLYPKMCIRDSIIRWLII